MAITLSGPLGAPLSQVRTMLGGSGFRCLSSGFGHRDTVSAAIARVVLSEAARSVFETWTVGPMRYRIAWAEAGHKRASTWDAARTLISARDPRYVNDPTLSTWELIVAQNARQGRRHLGSRAVCSDPRFSWRGAGTCLRPPIPPSLAALARRCRSSSR